VRGSASATSTGARQFQADHDRRFNAGVDKVPRRIVDCDVDMSEIGS
jgi:hypothetical protein